MLARRGEAPSARSLYALAEGMLDSRRLTPPQGLELPARTKAFLDAVTVTGRAAELVPIGVQTGPTQPNRHSGIEQEACDYSGDCLLGYRRRAKNSLDFNYLAVAARHGAEVYPLHHVHKLEPTGEADAVFTSAASTVRMRAARS